MASTPRFEVPVQRFASFDGVELAYRTLGEGQPVVLLHGLFSHAEMNWLRWGHAQRIAAEGFQVLMLDFRAHGQSDAPHDPAAYPSDVLALDVEAFVHHLGLGDFSLGGFSLGARTTARLLARGMRPRRAVLAGMGLKGIVDGSARTGWFVNAIERRNEVKRGSDEWLAVQFMKTTGTDPEAAALVLRAHVDTPREALATIDVPTLVVCGAQDRDNGAAQDLVEVLPDATYVEVPGTHMSSVTEKALGEAIATFLVS